MRHFFKSNRLISAIACLAVAVLFSGCGVNTQTVRVTSYVSTDSTVYSSTAEIVKQVADSVVEIQTESLQTQWGMQYVVSGAGSGVIVAHDESYETYYIVTNNHVISGARQIKVALRSGETYSASLVAVDETGDIAVVSIKESNTLNVAVWGSSASLQIGEDVIAIGNPLGSLGGTVTKGIISAKERSIPVGNYTMTLLQTDTAINPGNSGGGLFNMRGELVGIVNAKTSDEEVEGICFAIPEQNARAIFHDLVTNGVVTGRVTFGIDVTVGNGNVVFVTDVTDAVAGTFAMYDRIYKINGRTISSMLDYHDALASVEPGDSVPVEVYRGTVQSGWYGSSLAFDSNVTAFNVTAKQLQAKAA